MSFATRYLQMLPATRWAAPVVNRAGPAQLAEVGIDDFPANRSPGKRYRTTPLMGLLTRARDVSLFLPLARR